MTDEHQGPVLVRDDALTEALRAIYARPVSEAYWAGLEARIMQRIDEVDAWWSLPDRWVRVGIAAAAAAVLLAAGLYLRSRAQLDRTMAVEAIVEVEGLESALARRGSLSQEEATLRQLIGNE